MSKIPTYDYFDGVDLESDADLEEALSTFEFSMKQKEFLIWESVIKTEKGLTLNTNQAKILESLISFDNDDLNSIYYVDEMPRPKQSWIEIVKILSRKLVRYNLKTYEAKYGVVTEGWMILKDSLRQHGAGLDLPAGISNPIEIVPEKIRDHLEIQSCTDHLSGLGQEEQLSLIKKNELSRVTDLLEDFKKIKKSVERDGLTINKFLDKYIDLPLGDELLLRSKMKELLGLQSDDEEIYNKL